MEKIDGMLRNLIRLFQLQWVSLPSILFLEKES